MGFPELVDTVVQKDKSMARKMQYDEEFKKNTVELLNKVQEIHDREFKRFGSAPEYLAKLEEEVSDVPFQDELQAENKRLRKELLGGEGDFKKVRGHLLETKEMKYTYI
ncbi:hypothetical protein [Leptospira kirschneri]|uniref:hypothetical protein n=1 Tax=Leptospira kirschneri TaxID=29507 RepID=UPI00028806A7|nr:hypothetical protein [Leptospira kirschneri]